MFGFEPKDIGSNPISPIIHSKYKRGTSGCSPERPCASHGEWIWNISSTGERFPEAEKETVQFGHVPLHA